MSKAPLSLLLLGATLIACPGGEETTSKPAAPQESIEEPAKAKPDEAMPQAPKNIQDMMAGLQKMATNAGVGQVVEPLHFRELYEVLPSKLGWDKAKPTGETINMPFKLSKAESIYTKGEATISINVIDGGWNPLLLAPYGAFLKAGFERETETGFERTTTIKGFPGWEKWDGAAKKGSVNFVVKDRFLVGMGAKGLDDLKDGYALLNKADIDLLVKAAEKAEADKAAKAAAK